MEEEKQTDRLATGQNKNNHFSASQGKEYLTIQTKFRNIILEAPNALADVNGMSPKNTLLMTKGGRLYFKSSSNHI